MDEDQEHAGFDSHYARLAAPTTAAALDRRASLAPTAELPPPIDQALPRRRRDAAPHESRGLRRQARSGCAGMSADDDHADLRAENARLVALLASHGIEWRKPAPADPPPAAPALSTDQKLRLFRRLFLGRTDVYPLRWDNKAGKAGYAPACANEWRAGICEKPRIKCADCGHRSWIALSDQTIFDHLAGRHTAGVYPLLADDTCNFLAVDFDDAAWREDAKAFAKSCSALGVPVALEISRSGEGAHAWVFFSASVAARDARRLGTALISFTCARTRQLKLTSYDRLFPSQDTLPKGGFGNLIALPLQKLPRAMGRSVFVDEALQPFPDQWAFLRSVRPMEPHDIEPTMLRATDGAHPLDVTFVADEDSLEPWKPRPSPNQRLTGPMPASVSVTQANLVYVEKEALPQALANRLVRLAAFQNPEFYRAQAMRMPVWDKPRVIGCAENFPQHIGLPRGCLEAVQQLLRDHGIRCDLRDERSAGEPLAVKFVGTLRPDQEAAAKAMLKHDLGVLCAPTAFGKTVTAAALIASRGVNTLVLVHRTELLRQWKERLQSLLDVGPNVVGTVGGGKARPTGRIDIALMQSLAGRGQRQGAVDPLVENYGQIVVDECHHLSAFSFEAILKRAKAKYVLGLTATPIRRDGQQPIIFMQCGPIRHTAAKPDGAPQTLELRPRFLSAAVVVPPDAGIQELFRTLAVDGARTARIAQDIVDAYQQGRKILVLTERTGHLAAIEAALGTRLQNLVVLQGRSSKKQRLAALARLEALAPDAPRVLLSTGKLVGEGFDHPPLDTLVLAMPISWKGTLQQYAGRLHRTQAGKTHVQIVDFVDTGHSALMRMWAKRQVGYRAMGYGQEAAAADLFLAED
jgi:superfamily II DNA or RNA helicase